MGRVNDFLGIIAGYWFIEFHLLMSTSRPWPYWRNLILFFLIVLVGGLLTAYLVTGYRGAQFYLRPTRAHRAPGDTPARFGVSYQAVTLTTEDGLSLAAWYTPPENGALILVAHGYGAARSPEMHAFFARHGYGVLSWDARAHGESEGEISTWGVRELRDVQAAIEFVQRQEGVSRLGAYGQSMGGATLIQAAASFLEIEVLVADRKSVV